MADDKPKISQEQSSPTDPPVSQEVKDTAPAVAQPGEERRYCKASQRCPAEADRGQSCRSRQKTVRFYN